MNMNNLKLKKQYVFVLFASLLFLTACASKTESKKVTGSDQGNNYREQYRPQFHFSPKSGWMNDPNGMVYYKGEYHLFYQYYPDSTVWGPMHWGHAVSTDMVHWQNLPIALYPDSLGYIFSGSAVVDWNNTAGFQSGNEKTLITIFTYSPANAIQCEGLAYSNDKGRTWVKYKNNPVLQNQGIADFRDPKVSWYEKGQKWMMTLAVKNQIELYSSPNLKDWKYESSFGKDAGAHGGVWECPDLFPLQVDGANQSKWVLIVNLNPGGSNGGSGTQYFVGDFNGHQFTPDSKETNWVDWGHDNYACVTWSDIPKEDGRRICLGWMNNWDYAQVVPTSTWRGAMTIPRELKLRETDGKYRVVSIPVKELKELRDSTSEITFPEMAISGERTLETKQINLNRCELELDFGAGNAITDSLGVMLENDLGESVKIGYSGSSKRFFIDRTKSGDMSFFCKFSGIDYAPYIAGRQIKLHLFIDAASVELFVDDGDLVMTNCFFPTKAFTKLTLFADKGEVKLKSGSITKLKSIWEN